MTRHERHVHRSVMTDNRVKLLIREQGGEYAELFCQMSEEDQDKLATAVNNLCSVCQNMGVKGALELLIRLGEYMAKQNAVIVRTNKRQN